MDAISDAVVLLLKAGVANSGSGRVVRMQRDDAWRMDPV
jgi:hypothetical protein